MFTDFNELKLKTLFKKLLLYSCVVLGLWSSEALSTEYYVSPDGTEKWPNCTQQGNPCRASNTEKSFLEAVAGDIVYFLDGTYSGLAQVNEQAYRDPVWGASNSGTVDQPITFKALNKGLVHLVGLANTRMEVPIIGTGNKTSEQYIVWDGFVLSAINRSGYSVMAKINIYDSDHITVQDCEIIGASHSTGGAINYEGVRIENADYAIVKNCEIHGFQETSKNHNTSGIKTYNAYNVKIYNNSFHNNNFHIYVKGRGNGNFDIGYNFFSGGQDGILNPTNSGNELDHLYHNNLFVNVSQAIGDGGGSGFVQNDVIIRNNTFYSEVPKNVFVLSTYSDSGHAASIYNNIFYSPVMNYDIQTRPTVSKLKELDHNLYYRGVTVLLSKYKENRKYTALKALQSSGELEFDINSGCGRNNNPGCGSMVTDPLFMNRSGNLNLISDFALTEASPAKKAGRGGIDMGANISLVGINNTVENNSPQ